MSTSIMAPSVKHCLTHPKNTPNLNFTLEKIMKCKFCCIDELKIHLIMKF